MYMIYLAARNNGRSEYRMQIPKKYIACMLPTITQPPPPKINKTF